jgi:VanZ family protein
MIRYYFSPLVWAGIILFLSSIPAKELPDLSFWKWLSFDKIAHAVLYSILSFQIMRSCIRQYANWNLRYYAPRVAIAICIVYGAAIEIYQETVLTDRHGEWMDMISNVIGTIFGVWIFRMIFYQYIR